MAMVNNNVNGNNVNINPHAALASNDIGQNKNHQLNQLYPTLAQNSNVCSNNPNPNFTPLFAAQPTPGMQPGSVVMGVANGGISGLNSVRHGGVSPMPNLNSN